MRGVAAAIAALALAVAPTALGAEEMGKHEENPAQGAQALALQALAMLDAGFPHEQAIEKLDEALKDREAGDVDLRAIRAAHAALHKEEIEQGHHMLHKAFPGTPHLVGVTFRPVVGGAEVAAGAAGAFLIVLAAVGLVRQRRTETGTHGASPPAA